MTLSDWLIYAEDILEKAECYDSRLDAKLLAAGVLKKSPGEIRFLGNCALKDETLDILNQYLSRRAAGEPLQYIENTAYFMDFAFFVDENVLIPRQDTETLVELALEKIKGIKNPEVLDMCTGSGAIALSLAHYRKDARVTASDISEDALNVAKKNAFLTGAKTEFVLSDLFNALAGRKFDLITVNPPYLTKEDMKSLQKEVKREPALALYGGEDGLDIYRRIAREIYRFLSPGGYALLEVGQGQAKDVLALLSNENTSESGIEKDLCGIDRVVWIRSL
ncbi:MAG: peptide chain release factor N(5)-glutamine methyltransferase [Clostridia bacterium]|nr:peptide chain release factor N(5)-glutamine methyltransferase [Clostridia bacterium]